MLEGYEEVCPDCNGMSIGDKDYWCNRCRCKGVSLTPQGEKLAGFVKRHVIGEQEYHLAEATRERVKYWSSLSWWARLRLGIERLMNGG